MDNFHPGFDKEEYNEFKYIFDKNSDSFSLIYANACDYLFGNFNVLDKEYSFEIKGDGDKLENDLCHLFYSLPEIFGTVTVDDVYEALPLTGFSIEELEEQFLVL